MLFWLRILIIDTFPCNYTFVRNSNYLLYSSVTRKCIDHQNSKSTLKEHFPCQLSSRRELIKFRTIDVAYKQSSDHWTDFQQDLKNTRTLVFASNIADSRWVVLSSKPNSDVLQESGSVEHVKFLFQCRGGFRGTPGQIRESDSILSLFWSAPPILRPRRDFDVLF